MSNQNKFRGKAEDGKWYYGNLITIIKQGGWWTAIQYGNDNDDEDLNLYIAPIYDSLTIGQCTGLPDINKQKIYDGDIIIDENLNTGIVFYSDGSFKCTSSIAGEKNYDVYDILSKELIEDNKIEVFGNIHDNLKRP